MEEKLISRLESAVARLEALSVSAFRDRGVADFGGADVTVDPSIVAFDDLLGQFFGRVSAAAEKIGGQVLEVTKIVQEAFRVQKELLVKAKQTQKPDLAELAEFLKPLNEVIMKANAMTEGRRSDFFNHLKSAADSLTALAWIAYTGKDCGMSMPIAHVEESWQMAEFYNNKILVEYKSKDPNHVEWAKAMKELYLPGLRDYVKSHYPLGPTWGVSGKAPASAPSKAPAPPPPPPASLFSAESSQPSSSKPKEGMAAVFQEINTSKSVTAGLRKVTADMKTKNRADRTGVVGTSEKEGRTSSPSFSKAGPPKLELQMGRKWVVENQIGRKNLVIDDCDAKQSVYVFGCKDSVLQIQGKVNNKQLTNALRWELYLRLDVVAACEIVNCSGVEVQCQENSVIWKEGEEAGSQSFIGINYGLVADNLPPPAATAKLLQSTAIQKVRLYGADPAVLKALANTGIGIVIGAGNGDIPALASDPNSATQWVNSNVLPYYPASNIILITIGNEVVLSGDQNLISQLLSAMQNMENALNAASLGGKIKVSTVHSMAVLSQSDPPSSGLFNPSYQDTMRGLLQFQRDNGSPLAINPYPFFAYQSDPDQRPWLSACFNPTPDESTRATGLRLACELQVDAVRSALNALGFKDIEILVAETGWPYRGDSNEVGPSIENARAYNGNLIAHLRSLVGTPLMPGKSVDTYLFAIYDEDLKPGPASERAFGLFKPDLSMTYDVGLSKSSSLTPSTPQTPASPSVKPTGAGWCMPKAGVSDAQLQGSLDYACGQGIDCSPIQPGGACFEPNTLVSHAAFAMNLYYQTSGKNPWDCDFSQTATLTSNNPSNLSFTSAFF
ncbi:hypothetical protein GH714_008788 [Hevea brasiliensis]|uniref:Adenylyl cyclase-associated protein n=1 Tax=Hevea brasiliensis TaxID=3981 RepID=A0A6A6M0N5_HEVBR|nr:hypothetical protein GH714_008788 [Hevea brasiliensis]